MTNTQIFAVTLLAVLSAVIIYVSYWIGRRDGFDTGKGFGQMTTDAEKDEQIRKLEASLAFLRADHSLLAAHAKKLRASQTFGAKEHATLLDIADKLRIAAATFSALRTGKKIERDTLALRDQALAMADLLEPVAQENAA
ncbi:MAG TPA: hypothetical protein VGC62_16245 [Pseudomonas sp.]|uniref:hypothetical protein n=1 Tax=Pseudomonas sp. TaxID=306 RepID=UPI002ED845C9